MAPTALSTGVFHAPEPLQKKGSSVPLPPGRGTVYCLRRVTLFRAPAASKVYARFGKRTLNRPSTHTMPLGGLLHSGIVACLCIVIVKESSDLVRLTAAAGGAFPVRPIECLALLLGVVAFGVCFPPLCGLLPASTTHRGQFLFTSQEKKGGIDIN